MKADNKENDNYEEDDRQIPRNGFVQAMNKRYKKSKMKDRRSRRDKDFKNDWRREWE